MALPLPSQLPAACPRPPLNPHPPCVAAALSWLRRRGPPLPESAVQRLFRAEAVKVFDPSTQKVVRARKMRPLPSGALLLLPKSAMADSAGGGSNAGGSSGAAPAMPPRVAAAAAAFTAALRGSLLHRDPDFLALNKPAGLACQVRCGALRCF